MKIVRAQGFTLVELVVVIAIIAILAAILLPRLMETQRDARVAKVKALHGSLRSAAALARSRCELDIAGPAVPAGKISCRDTPPMIEMDGHPVRIVNHYPAAAADGIDVAADLNLVADGLVAINGTDRNGQGLAVASRRFSAGTGDASACGITYLEAGQRGGTVVGAEVHLATDGC